MNKEALVLTSSAPLKNEMLKIKRLYFVCLGLIAIGCLVPIFWVIGLLGLVILLCVDDVVCSAKQGKLRVMAFKYDSKVSEDELMERLQPALLSKYGGQMIFQRDNNGMISIEFNNHIYDIHIGEDDTVRLWWRKSISKAFFSFSKYRSYKQNLSSMAIIAYQIQKCCGVC